MLSQVTSELSGTSDRKYQKQKKGAVHMDGILFYALMDTKSPTSTSTPKLKPYFDYTYYIVYD